MQKDFYERLDRLYSTQPQLIETYLQETLLQCHQEGDSEGIIAASNEMGSFFRGQGRYEDSLQCFQEALVRMEALGLADSMPYLIALMNRAGTLRLAGRVNEAVSDFQHVLMLLKGETGDMPYIRASTLNNLGLAYQDLERLEEAEKYVGQALEIIRTLPGMEAEIASSGNNLAALCLQQGYLDKAERWITEAMDYYQSPAGEHDPHLANAYTTLAALRCRQNRLEDALECYAKAASATERFFGKNLNYVSILYDAALLSHTIGRADAVERLSQVAALYEALQGPQCSMAKKARHLLGEWEAAAL